MTTVLPSPDRLLQEQMRLLARNVPALVVGTLLAASGTAALLVVNGQALLWPLVWLVAMAALCLTRWLVGRQHGLGTRRPEWWARWFVFSSLLAGLLWGALAAFAYDPGDTHTQAVVVIALAGIVASATQSLGPYFPAHLAFALPALLPISLRCLSSGSARGVVLGLLTLAFLLMAEVFARRIGQSIADATRLRFENEALAADLARERDRATSAGLAKARFLASASHDLRQPIHALALYQPTLVALSKRATGAIEPATVGVIAERMGAALNTINQLLTRLLDVSRLDAGAVKVVKTDVALEPLFESCVDHVRAAAQTKGLRVRVRSGGLSVHTDPAVLHTVVSNLLSNAVRYTERGGVLLSAKQRGALVELQVWDTGIGIADDEQDRITDEFFQASNAHNDESQSRGFGLGLAIAQRSALLLETPLRWRSVLGRGSVFGLALPRALKPDAPPVTTQPDSSPAEQPASPQMAAAASPHPRTAESDTGPGGNAQPARLQVLLVDEDEAILAGMAFLLRAWQHDVLQARSLREAARVAQAASTTLDAAMVDYHLSQEENGIAVATQLRNLVRPDLPVAIVTGDTTPEVMAAVQHAGLPLLHKPATAEAVQDFLRSASRA